MPGNCEINANRIRETGMKFKNKRKKKLIGNIHRKRRKLGSTAA